MEIRQELQTYLNHNQSKVKQLIRKLDTIAASPYSHYEERKAVFCKNWFEQHGGQDVYISQSLNVVCPCCIKEGEPVVIVAGNSNAILLDAESKHFCEKSKVFSNLKITDDAASLAALLACSQYFIQEKYDLNVGILFVANAYENGLNDMEEFHRITKHYGTRIKEIVTLFDGFTLGPNLL